MKQKSFSFLKNYKKSFGGSMLIGKRKSLRPLSTKHPIHLVLKSCQRGVFAPGNQSLEKLIRKIAFKYQIKVYDLALNWTHIHFLIRISSRKNYNGFVRELSSLLANKIRLAKPNLTAIFTLRPFTRILTWGKQFKSVFDYHLLNKLEAVGFLIRKKKLKVKRQTSAKNKL